MEVVIKRSLAEVNSLIDLLRNTYEIAFVDGHLLHSRENDVYKLSTDARSYILKVYPVDGMSESKLRFIDSHASIAYNDDYIVRTKSGKLKNLISYPEGDRVAVLYEYLESVGKSDDCVPFRDYGEEVARLHDLKVDASKPESIPYSKIEKLIVDINLNNNSKYKLLENLSFIENFSKDKLRNLEVGLCHGDCHIENAVRTRNGIRLIDLDFMAINYLVSDLASILWANHFGMGVKDEDLENFLAGYSIRKPLPKLTRDTFLYFIIKKEMLYISSYLERQELIGETYVNSELVTNRLLKLHELSDTQELSRNLNLVANHV